MIAYLKRLGFEKILLYGSLIALVFMLYRRCGDAPLQPTGDLIQIERDSLREMLTRHYIHRDSAPKGEVIHTVEKVQIPVYDRRKEQLLTKSNKELLVIIDSLEKENAELNYFQNNLASWWNTELPEPVIVEAPIVKTVKESHEDDHDLEIEVHSRGQLEAFNFDLEVRPKIVTTTKVVEKKVPTKNAFMLGLSMHQNNDFPDNAGFLGINQMRVSFDVRYARKAFYLGGGILPSGPNSENQAFINGYYASLGYNLTW